MSHNKRELIRARQQGGVLTLVCWDFTKFITEAECDSSGLGRWNWVKITNGRKNTLIILAYQYVKSKQTTNTIYN